MVILSFFFKTRVIRLKVFTKIMDSFEINKIIAAVLLTALNCYWYWKIYRYFISCRKTKKLLIKLKD